MVYEEKKKPTNVEEEINRGNVGILKRLLGVEEVLTVQQENFSKFCFPWHKGPLSTHTSNLIDTVY